MAGDEDTPPKPPLKIDISSPFFLDPQDRSGDFLTPTCLNDDNYDDWVVEIETVLQAQKKFRFFDGTIRGQLRGNILAQDRLPSLYRAYQLAIQDEQVHMVSEVKDEKPAVVGFALRSSGRGCGQIEKVNKSHLLCTHCKKIDHKVSNCFEKIGYSEWWRNE
ncbi:hypothetical protein J1N35_036763 [Gossypium stocksii]|uniref:Retrotransposon Copia-like N-terminal domain-containing protein n=1 Tax=Gossypium stocksii TaxID=47602 RepID=A0A9D3ZL17_9ROSI|nr:hypothetical protein J1N35_036763 [Gossypium stocksii]